MVELDQDTLVFRFPEVHQEAVSRIDFQRTLRIPDDNREYPLPPGLGRFPIEHLEDHIARLPKRWADHGGVVLPMYQSEALWINFKRSNRPHVAVAYPCAIKVAVGKVNALTGAAWSNGLEGNPQDYIAIPDQPWLDGFCVSKGLIRQFVAMPLGQGYTAEEQLSGVGEYGGIQIIVFPMKRERYEELRNWTRFELECPSPLPMCDSEMGLAPGGLMRQHIYVDQFGPDAWDTTVSSRCFVHILNSTQWQAATGKDTPGKPPTAADYTAAGLPWFDYYDDLPALDSSKKLSGLDGFAAKAIKSGKESPAGNEPLRTENIVKLGRKNTRVAEGKW